MSEVLEKLGCNVACTGLIFLRVMRVGAVGPGVLKLVLDVQIGEKLMEKPGTRRRPVSPMVAGHIDLQRRIRFEVLGQRLEESGVQVHVVAGSFHHSVVFAIVEGMLTSRWISYLSHVVDSEVLCVGG